MLSTGAQISSSRGRVHSPNTTSQRFLRTERPSVTAGGSRGNVLRCKCQWHADACGGQIVPATIHVVDAAPNSTVRGFSDARQPGDNFPVICLAVKGRLVTRARGGAKCDHSSTCRKRILFFPICRLTTLERRERNRSEQAESLPITGAMRLIPCK